MNWADVTNTLLSNTPTLMVLLVVSLVLLKKNKLSYKGHGLTVGSDEQERKVLRDQFSYAESVIEGFVTDPIFQGCNEWKVKHIADKVKDIVESALLFNHLTTDGSYIGVKQQMVYSAILKRSDAELVRTEEFHNRVNTEVRKLFEELISIREMNKQ